MAEELLDQVIQLLEEPLAGVELRRAWGPGWASRLLEGPVASGEVLSHHREGDRQETVLRFSLFAPEAQERREAAAALETAVVQLCPGCVEIDREEEREDSQTRLPCLSLRLVFAGGALGMDVKLGGKNYKTAGAVVSASQSGTELTSVGEETPFALRDVRREYQVELRGIDTDGLERMAVFTAELGGRVYTGCRWKTWEYGTGTAVFLATGCEEKEESA